MVVEEARAMDIPSTSTSDAHEEDAHLTQLNFNHDPHSIATVCICVIINHSLTHMIINT